MTKKTSKRVSQNSKSKPKKNVAKKTVKKTAKNNNKAAKKVVKKAPTKKKAVKSIAKKKKAIKKTTNNSVKKVAKKKIIKKAVKKTAKKEKKAGKKTIKKKVTKKKALKKKKQSISIKEKFKKKAVNKKTSTKDINDLPDYDELEDVQDIENVEKIVKDEDKKDIEDKKENKPKLIRKEKVEELYEDPEELYEDYDNEKDMRLTKEEIKRVKTQRRTISKAVKEKKTDSVEEYEVCSDFVTAYVNIVEDKNENVPVYMIKMPKIGKATEMLLQDVMEKMVEKSKVSFEDISNPNKIFELRGKFFNNALKELKKVLVKCEEKILKTLSGVIVQRLYGMGELDIIMADNHLEEVCINRADQPVCVYHKNYGWVKTDFFVNGDEQTYNYAAMIGRKAARDINSLNPIMDAQLSTGDRVAATLFPISAAGNTITFRRFSRNPWTITHLVNPIKGVMSKEMAALIWQALEFELNIMVCGGTASGKTSFLNAFCALMPKNQRIISVEDTREFILPQDLNWNWIPLVSRKENAEGHGSISMLDLIFASLRMRPDRIIVGEVRNREQAETMFEAMHTGHSVYTTMHADTVEQITSRLLEPPIAIPKNEVEALNLIVVQHRDRQRNMRRTLEIAEVLRGSMLDSDLKVNYLYRWRPRIDKFEKVEESIRLVDDLNLRSGMTPKEIQEDIKIRVKILQWLLDNNVYDTNMVGKVMKIYYRSKDELLLYIDQKNKVEDVIKE